MNQYNQTRGRSFRIILLSTIIPAVIIPSLLVAAVLIYQLNQNHYKQLTTKMQIKVQGLAEKVQTDLRLLAASLEQVAHDQNVVLVTEHAIFAAKVQDRLRQYANRNPIADITQVYDTTNWPVESHPQDYEMFIAKPLNDIFYKLRDSDSDLALFFQLNTQEFKTLVEQHTGTAYPHDKFIIVGVPLIKRFEGLPNQKTVVGTIVSVIPIDKLISRLPISEQENIAFRYQDQDIATHGQIINNPDDFLFETVELTLRQIQFEIRYAIPKQNAVEPINKALITVLTISLIIIVASIFIAFFMAKQLSQPFNNLSELVKDYSQGDFEAQVPNFNYAEFQLLASLMHTMAGTIMESRQHLEQKVAERTEALAHSNEELTVTLQKLKDMQRHLVESEKMSSLGQLVAGVAHEINTPIGVALTASTSLLSRIQELEANLNDNRLTRSQLNEFMEHLRQASEITFKNLTRAGDLIHNFKSVAVDQSHEELRRFKLANYIEEVLNSLQPQTKKYDVTIESEIDLAIEMQSYPGAIAQIITNFVINSLTHGFSQAQHHTIKVQSYLNDQQLVMIYQDDGKGIPQQDLPKIFDPFFTTKRGDGGSGLGMHIIYNLVVQKLGGTIEAESDLGKGVKFTLLLPLIVEQKTKH
ncbi:hypothetical protein C2869_06195 [Saccharobesus litoralis]|uniref:histidine kinase n=1 Tax=Saccharobesus litoralis TaxID=2172099 RepID=A0A2S0VPD7_9ALTE|nr:HAMP domain-containing sensor histidine kinase [Saccharobesus litoralis]AWB66053.1 hypothetical protein C2869_06195 [Saccharobesus litoralis]